MCVKLRRMCGAWVVSASVFRLKTSSITAQIFHTQFQRSAADTANQFLNDDAPAKLFLRRLFFFFFIFFFLVRQWMVDRKRNAFGHSPSIHQHMLHIHSHNIERIETWISCRPIRLPAISFFCVAPKRRWRPRGEETDTRQRGRREPANEKHKSSRRKEKLEPRKCYGFIFTKQPNCLRFVWMARAVKRLLWPWL